ncbi:GAF domain-containing protein [Nocardioides euryhalodurans]|uniref:GAF domain-containing protein n=1 Tax=Nocardioides euryhalodurans TaxID=2518370 RepID=A0A4P7GH96_9ACTN|nr:GAF domain-containing protein [Nocardioides euryhalodurans]QBR91260.1 GAF domain-containing protein [Nocardioides euryhalodurans]
MVERALRPERDSISIAEHERLRRDFDALREQFEAADEVLSAIGRSAADPERVLATVVESARRLCRSQAAHLYFLEDDVYQLIKSTGLSEESIRFIAEHPMPLARDTLIGRVGLDRRTQQIPDVLADPEYGRHDLQRVGGFRTTMGAPLLVDGEVVGALLLWRNEVSPFDEREKAIVTAFAAQAAMAVNGVKLVQQMEAGGVELAKKVEELEALREVGEAVGSSLDVDRVLATIAMHAVKLSGTDGGSIMEYSEEDRCFMVRSVYQTDPHVVDRLHSIRIDLDETLVGRAARERRPMAVPDLDACDLDPHLRILHDDGWRSLAAVPMLREDQVVGALIVRRRRTGAFTSDTLDLLETFASQSALALVNAQLFRELKEQSIELELASTPYAIELNLRKGGTTHPFLTLQFLTDGRYEPDTALFLTPRGHEKHLVATDHLESDLLRGLTVPDLFDVVARHGLHFDQSRQVGVVFHMISCLTEHGRIGLTAVGDTPTEADRRYRDAERILVEEARLSLQEAPLPV